MGNIFVINSISRIFPYILESFKREKDRYHYLLHRSLLVKALNIRNYKLSWKRELDMTLKQFKTFLFFLQMLRNYFTRYSIETLSLDPLCKWIKGLLLDKKKEKVRRIQKIIPEPIFKPLCERFFHFVSDFYMEFRFPTNDRANVYHWGHENYRERVNALS